MSDQNNFSRELNKIVYDKIARSSSDEMVDTFAKMHMPDDIRQRAKSWRMESFCEVLWSNAFQEGWRARKTDAVVERENKEKTSLKLNEAFQILRSLQIASCTCLTKTPIAHFHEEECRYKKLELVIDILSDIQMETDK